MSLDETYARNNASSSGAPVLSVKDWLISLIVLAIPLVNIIMLFVWAFGDGTNPNKRNYSRAALLLTAIVLGLYIIFAIIFFVILGAAMSA